MKKRKNPHGWYNRKCHIQCDPIPGLSNNNLRMNHIPTIRSRTSRRWINKHWDIEISARWANWKNKIYAYGIGVFNEEES